MLYNSLDKIFVFRKNCLYILSQRVEAGNEQGQQPSGKKQRKKSMKREIGRKRERTAGYMRKRKCGCPGEKAKKGAAGKGDESGKMCQAMGKMHGK